MFNLAIKIENLGKMYKLYKRPKDKILDAFNLNLWKKNYYQEFWALRNINLDIKKGERIGIVGRNGAGKSTLLKVITGNVVPTEGQIKVNGKIQALLSLGTGFHPEFTGRENIRASLAYQGLTSKQISDKEREVIDFAELEEFIDQPIKTYSAGMYARLAFSTATVIEPDILIIDEVLGAGDAYFASKCIDKMKRLTHDYGATVLFVSHDMSSVEMLCERAIWIDRGKLIMDGSTAEVSKAYSQMVRERTLQRLNLRNSMISINTANSARKIKESNLQLIIRFVWVDGEPISINTVELYYPDAKPITVKIGEPQDISVEYDGFVLIDDNFSQWQEPIVGNNMYSRKIIKSQSISSAVVFNIDGITDIKNVELKILWQGEVGSKAKIEVYDGTLYQTLGNLEISNNERDKEGLLQECKVKISDIIIKKFMQENGISILNDNENPEDKSLVENENGLEKISPNNVQIQQPELYTGAIDIKKVSFIDSLGRNTSIFKSFESMTVKIDYVVNDKPIEAEFVVCIHRMGIIALQAISGIQNNSPYKLCKNERGSVYLEIPNLNLGKGEYLVSIGVFPPLNYKSLDTERTAYLLQDRKYEVRIEQPEDTLIDLGMCRSKTSWKIDKKI